MFSSYVISKKSLHFSESDRVIKSDAVCDNHPKDTQRKYAQIEELKRCRIPSFGADNFFCSEGAHKVWHTSDF